MGNQCEACLGKPIRAYRNQSTKNREMLADGYSAASMSSEAWSSKNQSLVDAQRLKIEAMMNKSGSDESNHVSDDNDRKCWWLDDKCDASEPKNHESTSRTAPKIVTFSSSLEHQL